MTQRQKTAPARNLLKVGSRRKSTRSPTKSSWTKGDAFTLVEVVLALGVASFALISLLGLLAMGTTGLSHSMDMSVETQIIESIDSEVENYDYSLLVPSNPPATSGTVYLSTYPRYYDADGGVLWEGPGSYPTPGSVKYAVNLSEAVPGQLPIMTGVSTTGTTYTTGSNSMQLVFTMSNQLDRSGMTLSQWAAATGTSAVTGTASVSGTLGKTYCIWAINNGR